MVVVVRILLFGERDGGFFAEAFVEESELSHNLNYKSFSLIFKKQPPLFPSACKPYCLA